VDSAGHRNASVEAVRADAASRIASAEVSQASGEHPRRPMGQGRAPERDQVGGQAAAAVSRSMA
jgi:hypothetical protein